MDTERASDSAHALSLFGMIEPADQPSPRRVVMLNTSYRTGGATHSGADLMDALRRRAIECRMFVGAGADPKLGLFPIPPRSKTAAAVFSHVAALVESRNAQRSRGHSIRRLARRSTRWPRMASALLRVAEWVAAPRRVSGWYLQRLSQAASSWPRISSRLSRTGKAVGDVSVASRIRNLSNRFDRPWFAARSADYIGPVGSFRLLDGGEPLPDILHAHNLHGGEYRTYFDLRALPLLSARVPFVLSLRDAWTMSGHCAHSFDCDRWQTGCGHCPDLTIYPEIPTDRTARNWQEKREIYGASRLYVHAVSNWIKQRAERSILARGIRDLRVIHTGIDRSIFKPGNRAAARRRLGLPVGRRLLAFAATQPKENRFKDFACLRACLAQIGNDRELDATMLVAIGEESSTERFGSAELIFWPYSSDRHRLADLYCAADIYLHAAKVDTFPRAVLEALACGTPVIATAVGGISEQIRSLDVPFGTDSDRYPEESATGVLVKAGDAAAMAAAVRSLSTNELLMRKLGTHAAMDAADRFDLERQTDRMVAWYKEVIADFHRPLPA
jgi:glycosyltransferase involved in cell wall biosynthesis